MKNAIIVACGAFTVAGTLTLAAQTPPTPQSPQTPNPSPSPSTQAPTRSDEKMTTLTGCLKAWDAATNAPASGTATTPGTTAGAPASRFVLTNVQPDSMAPRSEGATTPGASSTAAMGSKQYVLTADAGVNLAAHLNHQVRVTGKATSMADHSATGSTRPGDPARPGSEVPAPKPTDPAHTTDKHDMAKAWSTLAVTSVTMVSATCTGATL